jgi:hypothetical protein
MTRTVLPLAALVAERCRELGLRRRESRRDAATKIYPKVSVAWSKS